MENIALNGELRAKSFDFSVKKMLCMASSWYRRDKTRSQLAKLPKHLLDDIGLNSEEALREANKPFWE